MAIAQSEQGLPDKPPAVVDDKPCPPAADTLSLYLSSYIALVQNFEKKKSNSSSAVVVAIEHLLHISSIPFLLNSI